MPRSPRPVHLDLRGGGIDVTEIIGGECDGSRGHVLVQTRQISRARNRHDPWLLGQQSRQRDLSGRRLFLGRDLAGTVVIEPHSFFMAMYATEVSLVSIRDHGDGRRVAKLTGELGCATEAGTASGRVGSREAEEPAFFEIEATDGGHGGGAARDAFAFIVYFDPERAPLNHAIFGPNPTFTGEMIAGEITIDAPAVLPLIAGTPIP